MAYRALRKLGKCVDKEGKAVTPFPDLAAIRNSTPELLGFLSRWNRTMHQLRYPVLQTWSIVGNLVRHIERKLATYNQAHANAIKQELLNNPLKRKMFVALPATKPASRIYADCGVAWTQDQWCSNYRQWYLVEVDRHQVRRIPFTRN